MIHVRIVNADFYMSPPVPSLDVLYSEFRGVSVNHVPIIRIFGTTTKGDKTCLHVHGVFPYIYIPHDGKESSESVTYQVATSLDKAINLSLGQASSNVQHVYKVSLVSGIPMYGYHSKKHQFLKIFFYNPLIVKKACNLLQQGNILGRVFQPHEAHLPYLLQFMIDYNLQGMSFIDLSQIKYRSDSNNSDLPSDMLLPSSVKKLSICKIEMDARAEHILNHLEVMNGKLAVNPGIKALWDDEKQRRRNKGDESQIGCCLTQTRNNVPPTATHMAFMQVLQDKLTRPVENSQTNFSVYPMETPSSGSLLDASTIDSHHPVEETNDHDVTLNDSVFDDDAKYLLDLLEDLRDNNRIEEDSILSQVAKDDDDNEVDLSLPLEVSCESNDLFSDSIRIPQLDGSCDDYDVVRRSKPLTLQSYEVTKKKPVERVRKLFNKYRKRKSKTKIVNQIDDEKSTEDIPIVPRKQSTVTDSEVNSSNPVKDDLNNIPVRTKQNTDDLKQISAAEANTKSGTKRKRKRRIYLAGSYNLRSKGNSESENPDISPLDSKAEKVPVEDFNLNKELNVKTENFQETFLENDQNVCVNPVHSQFSPKKSQDLSSNDNVDSEVFPKNLQNLSTNVCTSSSGVNLKFSPKKLQDLSLIEKIPPGNSNFFEDLLSNDKIISTGFSPVKLGDCVESKSSPKKLRNILADDTKKICAENGLLNSKFSPKNVRDLSSNNLRKICTRSDSVNSKFFPNNVKNRRVKLRSSDFYSVRKSYKKQMIKQNTDDLKQISAAEPNTISGTKHKRKRRIYLAGSYNLRSKSNSESENPDISPHDSKAENVPVEDFNLNKELNVKIENFQETFLENDQNVCVNPVHSEFSPKKPQDLSSKNDNVDSEVFPKNLQDLSTNVVRKICSSSSGVNLKFSPQKLQDLSLIEKIPPGNSNLLPNDDKIISTGFSPVELRDCVESKSSLKKLRNILANDTKKICAENGLLNSEFSPKKVRDLSPNNSRKICIRSDSVNSKFFPNNLTHLRTNVNKEIENDIKGSEFSPKKHWDRVESKSSPKKLQDHVERKSSPKKLRSMLENDAKKICTKNDRVDSSLGDLLSNDLKKICTKRVNSKFFPNQDSLLNVEICTENREMFSPRKLQDLPLNDNVDSIPNKSENLSSHDIKKNCIENGSVKSELFSKIESPNQVKKICNVDDNVDSKFFPKEPQASNDAEKICTKNVEDLEYSSKRLRNDLKFSPRKLREATENDHVEISPMRLRSHVLSKVSHNSVESKSSPKKLQDHAETKSSPKKLRNMLENDAKKICTANDRVDSPLGNLLSNDLKKICTKRVNLKFFPKDDQDSLLNVEICTENREVFSPRKLQDLPLNDNVDSIPNKYENLSSQDIKNFFIENGSVKLETFSKIESPNQVKKMCNVDGNVDSKFFRKGQASIEAEKICIKNLVDLEYSSNRLRNDLKFSPRKLRKATENDHVEFSPMRLRSHVLLKVSHNNLRNLLPNDDKICTGDRVDNMEISPEKDFSLNVVPKVCNGNDVDVEFSPKNLQGFSSKPTENDSQVGCEANSLQKTENQSGNKKSRLSKHVSKQSLTDSNHVLDKPVNEFQDNPNEFLNSQNFIIKVSDSVVSVKVCENTMSSGDEFDTEIVVSPKVRDRIVRKVSEKQSPKKNPKLALKNDQKKGTRRSDLDFLMENSSLKEFNVEVEGDSNCRYSLRKGLKFNKFESIPKGGCCVSWNTSTNNRKNPKKKVEKIHPESNLDNKVTLNKILDMPEIDIQHTDLNKIYCSLTKEEKGVHIQSSSCPKVTEFKKKIEKSPRKNFVVKKLPIQKINNAATPILSPKFRIVPANRPYKYVPKRAGKNKSTTMKKLCKIRKNYPNTSWMFCMRQGTAVQSANSGKIDIISDKILLEHEKFDISELPRGNVTSIISHKRDSSANQTNETPKISDDAEIMNTLSHLYDEIMYDSKTQPLDVDDVLKEFSYDTLFLPEELEQFQEFETNNFEESPLSFEPKQDVFVCTQNEATDLHNGAPSPRKITPVIMFDEASQDSGRSTKKSRRFSTESDESDVYISDYEVKVEENGIFDRAHDDVQSDDSKNASQPIIEDVSSPIISQNNESLISPMSDEAKTFKESINDDTLCERPVRPVSSRERNVSLSEVTQITGTFSVTSNFIRAINYKLPAIDDDYFDRIKRDRDYRNMDRIFCYEVSEQKDLDFRCSFANRFCNFDLLDENAHLLRNNERFKVFLDSNVLPPRSRSTDTVSSTRCAKRCDDKYNSNRGCVVNQYRYLDGANDSSSDDDQMEKVVKKRHVGAFLSQASKYSPLSVKIQSPRTSKRKVLDFQDRFNEPSFSISIKETIGPENLPNEESKNKIGRKLSFSQCGVLNETSIEENLMCRYHKTPTPNAPTVDTQNFIKNPPENESDFDNSDDLFSPEMQESKLVEAYDFENNFVPMAGPSCKFNSETSSTHVTPQQIYEHRSESDKTFCANLSIYDGEVSSTYKDNAIIVPKYNPPTKQLIASTLSDFNIPEVRHQEPFYGDWNDVTGNVEVGHRVLKVSSKTFADLDDFGSFFSGIDVHRKIVLERLHPEEKLTGKVINNYKLAYCKDGDCAIIPVKVPPSRKDVELWLQSKKIVEKEKVKERKRIFIPCSPDGDSCDSMSISPCSPIENTPEKNGGDSPVIKKNVVLRRRKDKLRGSSIKKIATDNDDLELESNSKLKTNDSESSTLIPNPENESKENSCRITDDFHSESSTLIPNPKNESKENSCQITGVSFENTHNFAISLNDLKEAKAVVERQYLTILSMELHVQTRGDFKPDPNLDPIQAIIYSIQDETDDGNRTISGAFVVNDRSSVVTGFSNCDLESVDSETNLLQIFASFVQKWDPDVVVGYEIETSSWGFLIERGNVLSLNLLSNLSRIPKDVTRREESLKITGRIVLDFWRLLRHEIALQSYSFENIVYHFLHRRIPAYSFKDLSYWWSHPTHVYQHRTLNHFLFRTQAVLKVMDQLDLIGRTSELARLFGIQFYEVLSRGSQFRVESMMLRLAKPLNYIPVSPNVQQRARMRAPESLPLIMEPESKFYSDPVVVLDFQSLYPSIIIGYNYCFTTCLGRVEHLGQNLPFEFGATQLKISKRQAAKLLDKNQLNFSPCGVAFVKKQVREGILPKMLQEILDTRLMVKKSMKENSGDKLLEKVLHARQLGLKLIANVTYGYTAANFSGRMPAIEIGDSVVSKGRETLQRTINLVERTSKWGAKVVYGDTDSLFVLIAGKSKEDAFKIGAEIAQAVTDDNPSPIKLKLEKIFQPCILQTKKRYVGYMYESPDQKVPEFCAKGIETVRRDGCPASSKMLEKCLKMLFDTRDVSLIRKYVLRQFGKLLSGRVSIQDLTFAKEYRGNSGYRPGACVPALELARKWTSVDKRNEPRSGERVPYVIVNGPPGVPLIRMVRSPRDLLADSSLRPNAVYYITKVIIPPINRCFMLIGVDVNAWYNEMPRKQFQYLPISSPTKGKKSTISQYFSTSGCAVCGQQTRDGLCGSCIGKPQHSYTILQEKVRIWERNFCETRLICESCCGRSEDLVCVSLDCPVLYRRSQTERDLRQSDFVRHLMSSIPQLDF